MRTVAEVIEGDVPAAPAPVLSYWRWAGMRQNKPSNAAARENRAPRGDRKPPRSKDKPQNTQRTQSPPRAEAAPMSSLALQLAALQVSQASNKK